MHVCTRTVGYNFRETCLAEANQICHRTRYSWSWGLPGGRMKTCVAGSPGEMRGSKGDVLCKATWRTCANIRTSPAWLARLFRYDIGFHSPIIDALKKKKNRPIWNIYNKVLLNRSQVFYVVTIWQTFSKEWGIFYQFLDTLQVQERLSCTLLVIANERSETARVV